MACNKACQRGTERGCGESDKINLIDFGFERRVVKGFWKGRRRQDVPQIEKLKDSGVVGLLGFHD